MPRVLNREVRVDFRAGPATAGLLRLATNTDSATGLDSGPMVSANQTHPAKLLETARQPCHGGHKEFNAPRNGVTRTARRMI